MTSPIIPPVRTFAIEPMSLNDNLAVSSPPSKSHLVLLSMILGSAALAFLYYKIIGF